MKPDRDLLFRRPPLVGGMAQVETIHEDVEGNVLDYDVASAPGFMHRVNIGRQVDTPAIPILGPLGNILITIPTVGHNKFATDIAALTGWQLAIGVGTADEAAGDTALSSMITTYGGASGNVTPSVLTNVVTWTNQWTFTTGASFAVDEVGLFRVALMLRHKYSSVKNVVTTDKLTCTVTDTL